MAGPDLLPEIAGRIMADPVKVDDPGMRFGAVADQITGGGPQVDRKAQAFGNHRGAGDQRFHRVQGAQGVVGEGGRTEAKPDLVQALAGAHQNGKAARADLGI